MAAGSADALQDILKKASVHYMTVGDLTYSVLRQAILSGVLMPGQQLRQDALAEALGVSRIPVRSALLQLESDGLIEVRPHRGAIVATLSPEQIHHIYEARIVLECYALGRAIERMTPERLAHLEGLAEELDSAEPGEGFVEARFAFYRELYLANGNPVIVNLIERLRNDVGRYWLGHRVAHGHEPEHARLLGYVRRRDAAGATRWLSAHLKQVAEQLALLVGRGEQAP
jgi:DNA-binding GntR family transcriptional regulator